MAPISDALHGSDMFVAKIDSNGVWQWVEEAGTADSDTGVPSRWTLCRNMFGSPVIFAKVGATIIGPITMMRRANGPWGVVSALISRDRTTRKVAI